MATKSENSPITNAFGPGAAPMQYEPFFIACEVVELYGFYKIVVAQF